MPRSSWFIPLWIVAFACSGKSGLSSKPDASLADADVLADVVSAADLPVAAADVTDTSANERPTDAAPAADLPPDTIVGRDVPVEAAPAPDTAADLPSALDLAIDRGVVSDLGQDMTNLADLPADKPADIDLAVEARPDSSYLDACQAVANSTFVSTEEHECGLTPTGPGTCPWRISFTDNGTTRQLSWQLSDYSLGLVYQCNGFALRAQSPGGAGTIYTGTYDPATGILLWDGFNYTKIIR